MDPRRTPPPAGSDADTAADVPTSRAAEAESRAASRPHRGKRWWRRLTFRHGRHHHRHGMP